MEWTFAARLLIAGVLGAVIGLDREYRAKEAGLRTHFLVSLGSALFMIISMYGFSAVARELGANYDVARVAAQVVSGIGFLGAGTIIIQKHFIRGLTTAAGLWATAGIGMAIGGGMYFLGIIATVLVLAGLELLNLMFKYVSLYSTTIVFYTSDRKNLTAVLDEINNRRHYISNYTSMEESHGGILVYKVEMTVRVRGSKEQNALFLFIQSLDNIYQLTME